MVGVATMGVACALVLTKNDHCFFKSGMGRKMYMRPGSLLCHEGVSSGVCAQPCSGTIVAAAFCVYRSGKEVHARDGLFFAQLEECIFIELPLVCLPA